MECVHKQEVCKHKPIVVTTEADQTDIVRYSDITNHQVLSMGYGAVGAFSALSLRTGCEYRYHTKGERTPHLRLPGRGHSLESLEYWGHELSSVPTAVCDGTSTGQLLGTEDIATP